VTSFRTLLAVIGPPRSETNRQGRVRLRPKALEGVMVRRLKDDIRAVQGGFPKREVFRITIDGLADDAPELVLSRLLDEYLE